MGIPCWPCSKLPLICGKPPKDKDTLQTHSVALSPSSLQKILSKDEDAHQTNLVFAILYSAGGPVKEGNALLALYLTAFDLQKHI